MSRQELNDHSALQQAIASIDPSKPVYMLNLLKFRPVATYNLSDSEDILALPPCSGREAWNDRYVPEFFALPGMSTTKVPFSGRMMAKVLGVKEDEWDEVALVKYESVQVFKDVIMSEEYAKKALAHRIAALADARLFAFEFLGAI